MASNQDKLSSDDHDLLIEINTKLGSLKDFVLDLGRSTQLSLDRLNHSKADLDDVNTLKKEVESHTNQLNGLEKRFWIGVGILAAVEFFLRIAPKLQWVS